MEKCDRHCYISCRRICYFRNGELQADLMGILFSAGSVILWSAASVSIRRISEYYDPVQTALYGMAIALILNVPAAVFENMFIFRSHPTEKSIAGLPVCCGSWNCGSTPFGIRAFSS